MIGHKNRLERITRAAVEVRLGNLTSTSVLVNRFKQIVNDHTIDLLDANASWYELYNNQIRLYKRNFPIEHSVAVAAVAAMSPSMSPHDGLAALRAIGKHVFEGEDLPPIRTFKKNVQLAIEIVRTSNLYLLKGQKVRDFYHAIYTSGASDRAPIDRWSAREFKKWQKVKDKWPEVNLNTSTYNKLQKEFKKAADELGLYPAELQAILWVNRRGNG